MRGDSRKNADDWREALTCFNASLQVWTADSYPLVQQNAAQHVTRLEAKLGPSP